MHVTLYELGLYSMWTLKEKASHRTKSSFLLYIKMHVEDFQEYGKKRKVYVISSYQQMKKSTSHHQRVACDVWIHFIHNDKTEVSE